MPQHGEDPQEIPALHEKHILHLAKKRGEETRQEREIRRFAGSRARNRQKQGGDRGEDDRGA